MPAVWSEEYFEGGWLVSRYAEVEQGLRSPLLSARRTGGWVQAAASGQANRFQALFSRAVLFLDAPDHGPLRSLLTLGLRPETVAAAMPALVTRLDAQMAAILAKGATKPVTEQATEQVTERVPECPPGEPITFDAMAQLIHPLPMAVMSELLGLELEEGPALWRACDQLADFLGSPAPSLAQALAAQEATLALSSLFNSFDRRDPPDSINPVDPLDPPDPLGSPAQQPNPMATPNHHGRGLIGLLQRAVDDGLITDQQTALAQALTLLFAGHETSRNLLGLCLWWLLCEPSRWDRLDQSGPDGLAIDEVVKEVLRIDSPVQMTGRRVAQDCELFGQSLRRGELVLFQLGLANHDPEKFPLPDQFQPGRPSATGLAFGTGPHVCLGAGLSMLEARTFLKALRSRWPGLRLSEDAAAEWRPGPVYRGLLSLPVVLTA